MVNSNGPKLIHKLMHFDFFHTHVFTLALCLHFFVNGFLILNRLSTHICLPLLFAFTSFHLLFWLHFAWFHSSFSSFSRISLRVFFFHRKNSLSSSALAAKANFGIGRRLSFFLFILKFLSSILAVKSGRNGGQMCIRLSFFDFGRISL